ncbi:DUF2273 domain-containing protein [Paratractidigestivibacter sp.]|uniref:DUF2273 domain-containing protein n=1 Tax=Paratractidigestivibacter sp. TaxID=2847316 RepID=UPI002ABE1294|nr:DUF2273 domain-containing protein [Paratractidigestivibacter sp.]
MADDRKTPRARVESGAPDDVIDAEASVIDDEDGDKKAEGGFDGSATQAFKENAARVGDWVSRTFPGHEHAFWGGVIGALLAILIFWVGIGKALGVAALVLIGIAVGQAVDGDPKIINLLRHFFSSNN